MDVLLLHSVFISSIFSLTRVLYRGQLLAAADDCPRACVRCDSATVTTPASVHTQLRPFFTLVAAASVIHFVGVADAWEVRDSGSSVGLGIGDGFGGFDWLNIRWLGPETDNNF